MKISVLLGRFEVILEILLMSSGDVRDAPKIYSWRSLIDNI